jgi:DNA-binding cell septation regulator SpoVG
MNARIPAPVEKSREVLEVSGVELRFVQDSRDGLVAWASCIVGDSIALHNIAVRRGRDGGLFLTYPARQSSSGARHSYFNPIHREAGEVLRGAVVQAVEELLGRPVA